MPRNHEVTAKRPLLKEDGSLREPGWSRQLCQIYDRKQIKAPAWRIKEWDYYLVMNSHFAAAFTISDNGYFGMQSVSFLSFDDEPWEHTESILNVLPMGRMKLPSDSRYGITKFQNKRLKLGFKANPDKQERRIRCKYENFLNGETLKCDIRLSQPPMDTMVIATPWAEKKTAFYYNQKINCMRAEGMLSIGDKKYIFKPEDSFATLDWGRGVWTYDNRWFWSSGNGIVEGKPFGFNLGYGFGDTSAATENMLFYDGIGHKLDDVSFQIPEKSYMEPWIITSSDRRFEMTFTPVLDRAACIDLKIIGSNQHQVFGRMNGQAVLDNGRILKIKDFMCFAEDVHNRY
ncbi:MAG: DUF2804 domain-containing protein [Lachnospiraceae bacterium]|nr:DUF2804 domain-containing protein [Lachnospiraceae bacterium]